VTSQSTAATPLSDIARLRPRQQMAMDCALCKVRLGASGRILGDARHRELPFRLWACAPVCTPRARGPQWPASRVPLCAGSSRWAKRAAPRPPRAGMSLLRLVGLRPGLTNTPEPDVCPTNEEQVLTIPLPKTDVDWTALRNFAALRGQLRVSLTPICNLKCWPSTWPPSRRAPCEPPARPVHAGDR
jgi:hypothetical protein